MGLRRPRDAQADGQLKAKRGTILVIVSSANEMALQDGKPIQRAITSTS